MAREDGGVIIVGAGPSGLAVAGSLSRLSIPYIILEREDCFASLWKKYAYDRLHFHLRKQFCELPHMAFPSTFPQYVPKNLFLQYLNDYVSHFQIRPVYRRTVESAIYDEASGKWNVKARLNDLGDKNIEEYSGRFLVVATGETANPFVPEIKGLDGFAGEILHSTQFKSGKEFRNKKVLVVGSGNSGMEIALDLTNHDAKTSVIVRSPIHVVSREMVYLALVLLKYLPLKMVDSVVVMLSKLMYGDLTKYGIERPSEGPFYMKVKYGKYPIIDVGTCHKIKTGEIQVLPAEIESVKNDVVVLKNNKSYQVDAIVFCTGFKRSTNLWLKGDDCMLDNDGIPKISYPNHWKGKKGLYCVGLSRRGLYGAKEDAENIANDIVLMMSDPQNDDNKWEKKI
ncbi:probable indole-3-pyruvate monooxygenase YUCCA10 [Humulus lupulus]|uniref:probable indole-3-pyruvate monooxygenase YUCCA10 n=1 Tax=Humulus lupulus TaxID=3486 RepID=UPI002B414417|nr:probable indole-3-pyruvate monooxygenase YUCCA10 [Humulus lupulus]